MKKMLLSTIMIFVLCSTVKAELEVFDASGNFMGILIGISGQSTDIYHPVKKFYYRLNKDQDLPYGISGDIGRVGTMYFTQAGCQGEMYVGEYGGLLNAVIKYRYRYFKVTGGVSVLDYASYKSQGECRDFNGHVEGHYSKVEKIYKPFSFIPAKPPFTLKYVASPI